MSLIEGKIDSVLLVDDDNTVNHLNRIIIKETGLVNEIKFSISGEDALEELSNYSNNNRWPGIILVDINMPGMNGWEFIEEFKHQYGNSREKCLLCMLSSSLDPADQIRAKKSGIIHSFVSKPLTTESFEDLYHQYRQLQ